jgi:hypothetical protein
MLAAYRPLTPSAGRSRAPAGIGGAGLLLQYLPAQTAMLVLASAMAVVTGYGLSRPELRRAVWPAADRRPGLPAEAGQPAG